MKELLEYPAKVGFFMFVAISFCGIAGLIVQIRADQATPMTRSAEDAYIQDLRDAKLRDRTTKLEVEHAAMRADVEMLKSDFKAGILQLQYWMVNLVITLVATSLAGLLGGLVLYRKVRGVPASVLQGFSCPLSGDERATIHRYRQLGDAED